MVLRTTVKLLLVKLNNGRNKEKLSAETRCVFTAVRKPRHIKRTHSIQRFNLSSCNSGLWESQLIKQPRTRLWLHVWPDIHLNIMYRIKQRGLLWMIWGEHSWPLSQLSRWNTGSINLSLGAFHSTKCCVPFIISTLHIYHSGLCPALMGTTLISREADLLAVVCLRDALPECFAFWGAVRTL